jgi:4-amino-4-deoxy-L-arabinose transferase-like glycosyltransferase
VKKSLTEFVRKHSLITISAAYLLSRLINLTKLPIFNDEAIYLDWGWKSLHTTAGLFYSLYDAKPPFLIWIFGLFESVIRSPLFAGRLVSVIAGLLTLIGIYKVSKILEDKKAAIFASALYITIPIFAFFDRQALMESAIAASGIWSFYFLLQILETKKDKYLIYLGLSLGIGIFIKLQALVFLIPIIFILIYKKRFKPAIFSFITCLITLSPLLFQKTFWASFGSNSRFMLSVPEILGFPFALWIKNLTATLNVSFFHLTPFIFLLAIYGIYLLLRAKKEVLPIFFLTSIVLIIFLGRSLGTRYVSSFLALTTIFASLAILSFKKPLAYLISGVAMLFPVIITALLIFSPIAYFNLLDKITVTSQKDGYMNDWTSGYGIPETVNYLESVSKDRQTVVGVRLDAGNPESAMFTYFNSSKNIMITYMDPRVINPELLKLQCLPSNVPVYFVARDGILNGLEKFFQEDIRFGKAEGNNFISVHSLKKCN